MGGVCPITGVMFTRWHDERHKNDVALGSSDHGVFAVKDGPLVSNWKTAFK